MSTRKRNRFTQYISASAIAMLAPIIISVIVYYKMNSAYPANVTYPVFKLMLSVISFNIYAIVMVYFACSSKKKQDREK